MKTAIGVIRQVLLDEFDQLSGFWPDIAPTGSEPPFMTYNDVVSFAPTVRGDGVTAMYNQSLQLNLFQTDNLEDDDLPGLILLTLEGMEVRTDENAFTSKVTVQSVTRMPPEEDDNLIHHEFTIELPKSRTSPI